MPAPLYLTKGELRAKLLIRLGYGGLGAAAGMFVPMADDLLEEAQDQLFQIFTDEKGVREWDITTGVNQRWYDIPLTCDIDRILGMWAQQNGDYWHPLIRGIDPAHDSDYDDIDDYPYRYDIRTNPEFSGPELQVNGDFAIDDTTALGGTGFTWSTGAWQISGGVLECLVSTFASVQSTESLDIGTEYTVEYTIADKAVSDASIGGVALPTAIGSHSVTFTATATTPFRVFVYALIGPGQKITSVSIKQTTASEKTQIEIWPKPDDNYKMKLEGPMILGAFAADGDRASFDSRLILLYAIAFGKAHLNKKDAKSAMDAWTTRLTQIKANQHGTREYVRKNPGTPEIEIRSRPKVI